MLIQLNHCYIKFSLQKEYTMSCKDLAHDHDFLGAKQEKSVSFTSNIGKTNGQDLDIGDELDGFGIFVMLLLAFSSFQIIWSIAKIIYR